MTEGFAAFWAAWPANSASYTRKGAKSECLRRWLSKGHDEHAEHITRHVRWLATSEDWQKDGGAFIPAPLVYLNQERWDGADIPETPAERYAREKAARDSEAARPRAAMPAQVRAVLDGINIKRVA